jgi:hypothetical protein
MDSVIHPTFSIWQRTEDGVHDHRDRDIPAVVRKVAVVREAEKIG